MTIEEVKRLKFNTERDIRALLIEFQRKTTLRVRDVELHSEDIQDHFAVRLGICLW